MSEHIQASAGDEPEEPDLLMRLQQDRDGSFAYNLVNDLSDSARRSQKLSSISKQTAHDRTIAFQTAAEIIERFASAVRRHVKP